MANLFLSNPDFLLRFDGRWVGKNINDDGTAASIAQLADPLTTAGAKLAILIGESEEETLSAAMVSARYSLNDLLPNPMLSPPYPGGGELLKGIIAGVTVSKILARRVRATTDDEKFSAAANKAQWYLEQLRRGERIFAFVPNVPQAGLPAEASMLPIFGIDPPLITQAAQRYFGLCNPLSGQSWGT